tara:strand:+ start:2919 stop:3101 length:183 start_codon:yes stop_codon:yes gene_type:complete
MIAGSKGGSMLADASVPVGLFALHRYLKKRSRKASSKASKASKASKSRRRKSKKTRSKRK